VQEPAALQTSAPLHTFASAQLVPAGSGVWVTPPCSVHASAVHGFWSSRWGGGEPAQIPFAVQVSDPSQAFPFEQLVPAGTGVCVTPAAGVQASVVQGFPSLKTGGVPARHWADALHTSCPLQRFASAQLVPAGNGVWMTAPPEPMLSAVQGFPSSIVCVWQVPAVHTRPAWQSSAVWHVPPAPQGHTMLHVLEPAQKLAGPKAR
jgi:hypothetical protein